MAMTPSTALVFEFLDACGIDSYEGERDGMISTIDSIDIHWSQPERELIVTVERWIHIVVEGKHFGPFARTIEMVSRDTTTPETP